MHIINCHSCQTIYKYGCYCTCSSVRKNLAVARRSREVWTSLPAGPLARPRVDPVTGAMRWQNDNVCQFILWQIETSTPSARIKRQPVTSSSPGGACVSPLILAWHRFLCSHFSAGGVRESVYYRSDKRAERSATAWLLVPGESTDASGGGGRGALMSRGRFSISTAPLLWFPLPLAGLVKANREPAAGFDCAKEPFGKVKRNSPRGKPRIDSLTGSLSYLLLQRIWCVFSFVVERELAGTSII